MRKESRIYWDEESELLGEVLLLVKLVREVDPADAAVGVDLYSQALLVVSTVGLFREIDQVNRDLIPALVHRHRHRAGEGFHPGCGLETLE